MTDSRSRNTTLLTMCIQMMHGYIIRKLEWSWDFVAIDESAKLMSGQKIPSCNNEGLGSMTSIWQYEMSCEADQIKWPSVWWNESIGTLGWPWCPAKKDETAGLILLWDFYFLFSLRAHWLIVYRSLFWKLGVKSLETLFSRFLNWKSIWGLKIEYSNGTCYPKCLIALYKVSLAQPSW